jgi:hypothetical protein
MQPVVHPVAGKTMLEIIRRFAVATGRAGVDFRLGNPAHGGSVQVVVSPTVSFCEVVLADGRHWRVESREGRSSRT